MIKIQTQVRSLSEVKKDFAEMMLTKEHILDGPILKRERLQIIVVFRKKTGEKQYQPWQNKGNEHSERTRKVMG